MIIRENKGIPVVKVRGGLDKLAEELCSREVNYRIIHKLGEVPCGISYYLLRGWNECATFAKDDLRAYH